MKTRFSIGAGLLAALCLASGCEQFASGPGEEAVTRVLMIGNSFSISVLNHLPQIAKTAKDAQGDVVTLDLASLYIGGCSLAKHLENVEKDTNPGEPLRPYRYDRFVDGRRTCDNLKRGIREVLRSARWDVVTIQQASHMSWRKDSYAPGDRLVALVRELAPQAKIFVQETWSYTPWDRRLGQWGIDQDEMYEDLHAAYVEFAERNDLAIIPFGTAVQEWRRRLPVAYAENSFGGDVVGGGHQDARDHFRRDAANEWKPNCDVFHLNRRGEYFQALVWAAVLLDIDPEKVAYRPSFVKEDEAKLMQRIAAEMED